MFTPVQGKQLKLNVHIPLKLDIFFVLITLQIILSMSFQLKTLTSTSYILCYLIIPHLYMATHFSSKLILIFNVPKCSTLCCCPLSLITIEQKQAQRYSLDFRLLLENKFLVITMLKKVLNHMYSKLSIWFMFSSFIKNSL